jgi:acyl-coenzyme A thioesterase 9
MATRSPRLRFFARAKPSQSISGCAPTRRQFAASATRSTDGVFRALTENRVRTPWVEALKQKQQEGKDPTKASGVPETPSNRDLSPRSMSDSYHSVVCSVSLNGEVN